VAIAPDIATSSSSRLRQWLIPSFTHWLWLTLFVVVLAEPSRTSLLSSDSDPHMHWALGEHMLATGRVLRADVFSHTAFGRSFVAKDWLAQVLMALAGRVAGLYGLCVLAALVIASTYALLQRQLIREGGGVLAATALALLAAWAGVIHWLARPHVITLLLALLWNGALRRFERDLRVGPLAAALAVLMLLWANLHGAFLMGFAILGAYWLGALLEWRWLRDTAGRGTARRKLVALSLVGLLSLAASGINPNGFKLHQHNIRFLGSDYMMGLLKEHRPPDFLSPDFLGCLGWLVIMAVAVIAGWRRLRASSVLLLLSWTYFGLRSARNLPLLAILSAPIVADAVASLSRNRLRALAGRLGVLQEHCRGWPVVVVATLAFVVLVPHPTAMPRDHWPLAAVDFIRANPDRFRGRMMNDHFWGGYLMKALPDHMVFVDARVDFFGEQLVRDYVAIVTLQPGWKGKLEQYEIGWTLFPAAHPINRALSLSSDWRQVYADGVAAIHARAAGKPQ
jgi:hypothetical protein